MGKQGISGMGIAAVLGVGLLGYNFLRQGQNTAATFTTARLANFRPVGLRGFNLACEVQMLFTNTHPIRSTALQSLGLTIASESGVIIGTVHQPAPQTLAANTTTAVTLPVTIELAPLLLQVMNFAALPALLKSFTGTGSVLAWVARQAGLRNCVLEGTALVDGLVIPIRKVVDLGIFAPTPAKTVTQLPSQGNRSRGLTRKVTA